MTQVVEFPDMNLSPEEIKMTLAESLLQQGSVSLGKAAEIAGYSERTFVDLLLKKGVSPVTYDSNNLEEDIKNA